MKYRHKNSQTRSLVVTASIGGCVLVYAFLVFMPTSRAIAKMRAKLEDKRQLIVAAHQEFTEIGAIQAELRATNTWVAAWKEHSPQRNNLGVFFGRIAEACQRSGTQIERITPEEPSELELVSRHPVRLIVGGTFAELFAFIQLLEELPLTVWIQHLELQPTGEASENLTCALRLTVFTDNQGISD